MPKNLGALLKSFERIIVPEMNTGQLKTVLRDQFLVDAKPLNKVSGHPFRIAEIEAAIDEALRRFAWHFVAFEHDETDQPVADDHHADPRLPGDLLGAYR